MSIRPNAVLLAKTRGFWGFRLFVEALEFFDDGIAEGDAAGTAIFGFFDVGEFVVEVDMFPFEIENFALAGSCSKRKKDDAIEVRGFASSGSGKKACDLVFRKDAVSAGVFFEFHEAQARGFR